MVLGTGWLILRWLHQTLNSKKPSELSPEEKIQARLKTVMTDYSPVKEHSLRIEHTPRGEYSYCYDHSHCGEQCEVSVLQLDLLSVQAVLEMRTEEVRRLRKELDRREGWREDKGTITGVEGQGDDEER
jgi:hypothetical protein